MSKSIGNVIVPQDVIKESGAEILRLWVAMVGTYRDELRVSKEILTRAIDAYRKIRNTFRYFPGWPICTTLSPSVDRAAR